MTNRRRSIKDNAAREPSELIALVLADNGGEMPRQELISQAGNRVTPERAYRFQKVRNHDRDGDMDVYIRRGKANLIIATIATMQRKGNLTIDAAEVVRPTARMLFNFTDIMSNIIGDERLHKIAKLILTEMATTDHNITVGMRKALRIVMAVDGLAMDYKPGKRGRYANHD